MVLALLVDEPEGLHGRSVSLAKYTAAFCRICFSSSSRATRRRSATISAFSSRVYPSTSPDNSYTTR